MTGVVHLYRELDDVPKETGGVEEDACPGEVGLPTGRNCQICVMSTPPDMGFAEFCTFLGCYFEKVKQIRLVRRDGGKACHLVLLSFCDQGSADGFYKEYNGKPVGAVHFGLFLYSCTHGCEKVIAYKVTYFRCSNPHHVIVMLQFCLLEPELLCHLLFVKQIEYCEDGDANTTKKSSIPQGVTELPSCPVCLERLDSHVSGIVTTVCNHKFHNQCLRQWMDSSCPVCRYCQHPSEVSHSCSQCLTSVDLWMCLICGHVGCGRYKGSHAASHFESTGHGYALELESQRIWDYAQDTYVHRLIFDHFQHSHDEGGACLGRQEYQPFPEGRSSPVHNNDGDIVAEDDEALVKSKLDALATEFSHMMVSQLESQRVYFESVVQSHHRETENALEKAHASAACANMTAKCADQAAEVAESKFRQIQSKNKELQAKLDKSTEEKEFLRQLNETLLVNQKSFSEKLKKAEHAETELRSQVQDLQEQVRDLMMFIEARDTIESNAGQEAVGGSLLPMPEKPKRRGRRKA